MFETLEAAAEALLHSTCARLISSQVAFVIVGGWSPYIRGGRSDLRHPGTRDVDVLFADGHRSVVEGAIKQMLMEGFQVSAKHAFQLLTPLKVGERDFVFNVDFMHPSEQQSDPELLTDVFDLGVPDDSDPTGRRWFKSIVFQSSQIVFGRNLFSIVEREGIDIRGTCVRSHIPLLDEAGLILSKLNSVKQVKRPRDAFDIYYTLSGPNGASATDSMKEIADEIDEVKAQIESLAKWLEGKATIFDTNVARYSSVTSDERPSAFVQRTLAEIVS